MPAKLHERRYGLLEYVRWRSKVAFEENPQNAELTEGFESLYEVTFVADAPEG